ncbi:leucine-rich repeat and IQ domain-containing protein 1 isoform X2 [Astyanax mexicanus]|nr:leucine-rich repeat and IQ domain-containing protein 1 isoform X2 [Astyanax mexicanus]
MDSDAIDRAIEEELEKMSLNLSDSDSDDTEPEEDFTECNEKLQIDFPDPVFTYLEASRGRMKTLEHLILEDFDEKDSSCNETSHQIDFENLLNEHGCIPKEDLMNLKERILSEIEEHVTDPGDSNGCSLENMKPTAHVNNETKCDAYKETEKQFIFEWRAMEERLRKEEDLRLAEQEAEREHHLHSLKEEEEKKKHRFEEFEEVLRTMSRMGSCEQCEEDGDDYLEQLQLEEVKQKELIKQLEEQLEEEKSEFEKTQQEERRRKEKRSCGAATKLQAAFRGALVRQWSKKELSKRREEARRRQEQEKERELRREKEERIKKDLEEKRRRAVEEEMRQKEEQEKRRVEYERAKEQERHRLKRERKLEEQNRREEEEKKIEEERKLKEEEERRKRIDEQREEEEKRADEKEREKKEDEERRKKSHEEKIEEDKRRAEKKVRKRKKHEDRKKRMDEEWKEEEKRRVDEKVWSRKEEEKKKNTEESMQVQKERKTINEDGSKSNEMEIKMKMKDESRKVEESTGEEIRNVDKEERKEEEDMRRKIHEPENKNKKQLEIKLLQEGKQIKLDKKKSNEGEEETKIKEEGEKAGRIVLTHPISSPVTTAPSHTSTFPAATYLDGARLQYQIDAKTYKPDTKGHLRDPADSMEKCPQDSSSTCLPERTELKRLAWMMNCVPWSKLSMQNKRKRVTASTKKREARRASMPNLPPLPVDTILRSGSWSTLKQVTTVTLEDLPGCSLSPLTECASLQSLTLRKCGLKALEALNHCSGLKHIDVQENSITYVNLGSLDRLEVLLLGKNQLTSIHGLDGAVNLTVLQLSYNIISRISGLGSLKRLQRLSVDHNQLISTRGLSDVFTLLHLDCSYNHLTHVEGLEHCALLNTLDLRGNSLSEIPVLKDHVLLRELYLDDNSISSLHSLDSCWLPLLHCLSVAQNNVTQLPLLEDLISLKTLDFSHNCLSELKNIFLSLQGCTRLQELNINDNPVEQENNWRSSILAVKPNLIRLNGKQTGASVEPSVGPTQLWSFQALCQAHQDQLDSVLEKHSMEISMAPTVLDAHLLASNHSAGLLCLAEQQRYAHEYGDSSVSDTATQEPAASSCLQDVLNCNLAVNERTQQHAAEQETQSQPGAHLPVNIHEAHLEHPKADITSECAGGCINPAQQSRPCRRATKAPSLDLKTMAAMVIQCRWRKYRRTGISKPPAPPKSQGKLSPQRMVGSSGKRIEPLNKDYAATVIQAIWRGYALRRRLACALALAQVSEGDEAFEEVDMDEFIFDEEAMENDWIALHSEASMSGLAKYSEQLLLPKPPLPLPEMHKNTPELPWKTRQAFIGNEGGATTERSLSQEPNTRRPSPPSSLRLGAPPERSEKILKEWGINSDSTALLILKRAQKMKGRKQQQQRKLLDPAERLALFRKSSKQPVPAESRRRYQAESRDEIKGAVGREEVSVGDASSGEPRQTQQPGTHQWLRTPAVRSQRNSATSERDHFLPEIDPEILNGGRVQLLAGTRYRESPDSAGRLWSDLTGFSSHRSHQAHVRRHSVEDAKVPSPKRVTSAPSRKERISFRDNPVQLSGGWGGGKKRARVNK